MLFNSHIATATGSTNQPVCMQPEFDSCCDAFRLHKTKWAAKHTWVQLDSYEQAFCLDIVRFFNLPQAQLDKLKADLQSTRVCVAMRNSTMQKQWRKSITLTHTLRTLHSIEQATKVRALQKGEGKLTKNPIILRAELGANAHWVLDNARRLRWLWGLPHAVWFVVNDCSVVHASCVPLPHRRARSPTLHWTRKATIKTKSHASPTQTQTLRSHSALHTAPRVQEAPT